MKFYRLKHIPSGLYYTPGTLSEKGKVYTGGNNFKSYLGKYSSVVTIPWEGRLHKKYKQLLESLDTCKSPRMVGKDLNIRISPIEITVRAEDFEIEYITPDQYMKQ
jgi:hypothetical protein